MSALAYTVGNDVVFGGGQYSPRSANGQHLLAHELTHVIQQNADGGTSSAGSPMRELAAAPLEREADMLADRVAGGLSVEGMVLGQAAGVDVAQCQDAPGVKADDKQQAADKLEKKEEKDPAKVEWDAHPKIHGHFNAGFPDYQDLRPLYMSNTGTANAAKWIEDNIVSISFFGHSTPAHTDMKPKVAAAEKTLKDAKASPTINDFWSFVPRRIRGSTALSKHALGKAVDINAAKNPRITDKDQLAALTLVTGLDFQSGSLAAADLKTKSDDFKATFNEAKYKEILTGKEKEKTDAAEKLKDEKATKEEKAEIQKAIKSLDVTIATLRNNKSALLALAKTGFMNLDTQLVQAFIDAGFTWGGQFQHSKDFMHFEID